MTPFLVLALIGVAASAFPPPGLQTHGGLWPLPQKLHYFEGNMLFDGVDFALDEATAKCEIIERAVERYDRQFTRRLGQSRSNTGILKVKISMKRPCRKGKIYPQQNMKEEYFLSTQSEEIKLIAEEEWGIIRGLETLSQLIFRDANGSVSSKNSALSFQMFIRRATVHDWPEYSVRGVLIDTSRHFLPVPTILRQIELLALNKMNVLHWHIVDSESFPYVSKKFPDLSAKGAFTPRHIYSPAEVATIVDFAALRGIRILAEVDTPGHMGGWKGQPGLLSECFDATGQPDPAQNLIDPTNNANYEFLRELLTEFDTVFPERFIHLGGDEVSFWANNCWLQNPNVSKWMQSKGFDKSVQKVEDYHTQKIQKIVNEIRKDQPDAKKVFWNEIFDRGQMDNSSIVHLWTPRTLIEQQNALSTITKAGAEVIVSNCWYLNYVNYGSDWKDAGKYSGEFYYCDPRDFPGTDAQRSLVLGGIATVWGEFIGAENVESLLWPRASAVAERLWSDPRAIKNADVAWPRLHEHRCRMVERGYRASPVNGPDFCLNEYSEGPLE